MIFIDPVANMPCTICVGSDEYAGHVVKRLSPKRILVAYNYKETDEGANVWSLRKNGRWHIKGNDINHGPYLILGVARDYLDPSF